MQNAISEENDASNALKPRKLWIDSTPFTPEGYTNESSILVESSPPRVKLIHFSTKPVVDFGNVKTGKTVKRKLVVDNPNLYEVEVNVEKFPWKKNFSLDEETFSVEAEGIHYLEITWTPSQSGNCRELVMMKYDAGFRVHVLIVGHAESPKKKVKTRTRRGAAFKKLPRRNIKADFNKTTALDNTENVDPHKSNLSKSTFGQDSTFTTFTSSSLDKTKDFQSPNCDVTRSVLEEKHDFSNLRNALLPFHVVSNNPRDSCGSITAPTSPSGLDAPIIEHHSPAPSPLTKDKISSIVVMNNDVVHNKQKVTEPHQTTYCLDSTILSASEIKPQSPFKEQETTGRPTYILPTAVTQTKQRSFTNPILPTPFTPTNSKNSEADRNLTPRSHRRSRTFTKREPVLAKDERKEVNMLDYALSVINKQPENSNSEILDTENNSSPEDDSLEDIKSVGDFTSNSVTPNIEITENNQTVNITTNLPSDEIAERLSSTHAHDRTTHDGNGLPVPDISVITSHSPLKCRKRKSPLVSPSLNKRRSVTAATRRPSTSTYYPEATKPSGSRIRRNSGVYGTPKGRALQKLRAGRSSETMPIHKAVGGSAKKRRSSVNKLSKSVKQDKSTSQHHLAKRSLSSTMNDTQKSVVKRRKVKMPITRLVLKSTSSKSMSIQSPKTAPVLIRLPFSSGNMYHDEKWREKQEHAYMMWLNYILTPDEFKPNLNSEKTSSNKNKDKTLQHSDVFSQKSDKNIPALSKEKASLRAYRMRKRLDNLRRSACRLFQSESMINVIRRVEEAVESGQIKVRDDKRLWADVGNKKLVLDLILSFHPLWLRVCLEVVFGEVLPIHANTDVNGLGKFVLRELLNCSQIAEEFAHPTVPHSFKAGYNEKIAKHTLKKFLILIYFLDQAKQKRLIDHDPCLFRKESKFRNCRDVLHSFSRDLLRGEGDIVKHLAYLGYKVNYDQTFIDEFEFGIKNIAVDLRDGVRLVRIVELLFHQHDLTPKLRVPASSLFQKKHNVTIAIKALESHGVTMTDGSGKKIEPDHVVRGHCEMTLALLWNIASYFQLEKGINEHQLKKEIEYLKKNLRLKHMMEKTKNFYEEQDQFSSQDKKTADNTYLLLDWCRLVCAFKSIPVHNFGASFSDGRVLAYLISYYQSNLISPSQICMKTIQSQRDPMLDDSISIEESIIMEEEIDQTQLSKNEKINLKLVQNAAYEIGGIPNLLRIDDIWNTIPDDKVVKLLVSFLCSRLLDISIEDEAARTIQIAWHAYKYRKQVLEEMRLAEEERLKRNKAASVIQAMYKGYEHKQKYKRLKNAVLVMQRSWRARKTIHPLRKQFLEMKSAAVVIQALYRAKMAKRIAAILRQDRVEQSKAVSIIQHFWRGALSRKLFLKKRECAIKIQKWFRNMKSGKTQRSAYLAYKDAVIQVQIRWRATLEMRKQVAIYSTRKEAAILIQIAFRHYCARKRVHAAVVIQRKWRARSLMQRIRSQYLNRKVAAVKIQCAFRCWLAKNMLNQMKRQRVAARFIEIKWRATLSMRTKQDIFKRMRNSAIVLQCAWRCCLAKRKVEMIRRRYLAATLIQTRFRSYLLMKIEVADFTLKKNSAITIQCAWRCHQARNTVNYERKQLTAVLIIQNKWRATLLMRKERKVYITKVTSAILIQSAYRRYLAILEVKNLRNQIFAARILQAEWRSILLMRQIRKSFMLKKTAAVTIQCFWRCFLAKQKLDEIRKRHIAAKTIQLGWRAYIAMNIQKKIYYEMKHAVIVIQCSWRCSLARREVTSMRRHLNAVMCIQKYWKATLEMRRIKEIFLQKKKFVILIQNAFRCFIAKRKLTYLKKRYAAIVLIQLKWRATLDMREKRKEYDKKKVSALVMQCAYRCYMSRKELSKLRQRLNATLKIQQKWKATLKMKRDRDMYSKKKEAVVKIQCFWRRFVARRKLIELRENFSAAKLIQSKWRATLLMQKQRKHFLEMKMSVVKIQCCWRCYLAKQKVNEMRNILLAAMLIQRKWRATMEMREKREVFLDMRTGAVKIQCAWRCILAKQVVDNLRTRLWATCKIQEKWRATICMRRQRSEFLLQKTSVTILQCAWRCVVAKKKYKEIVDRQNAALIIQCKWRATMSMRREKVSFENKKKAVVVLQCSWRCVAAKLELADLRERYNATVVLQRKWSATLLMRNNRREFLRKRIAVVMIQCFWRRIAAKKILTHKQQVLEATEIIQEKWRATLTMRKERSRFLDMKQGAIAIQSSWRCVVAKKKLLDLRRRDSAARIIQNRWRATELMKKERLEFEEKKNAAIFIQCHWRKLLAKKELCRLRKRLDAALVIQHKFRATVLMRRAKAQYSTLQSAALTIQCSWRCFLASKEAAKLRKQLEAIKVIQNHWRATLHMKEEMKNYRQIKSATIIIQCWWRQISAVRERMRLLQRLKAAEIIQLRWRTTLLMKHEHNSFLKLKAAAVVIQCAWRCYIAKVERENLEERLRAAMVIQKRWRATILMRNEREAFLNEKSAAITIQCAWRMGIAKRKANLLRRKLNAVILIQKKWKATFIMRKQQSIFIQKKSATLMIQCAWRSILAKRKVANMKMRITASCRIQSRWRATLIMRFEMNSLLQKRQAAIAMQRTWRGVLGRRKFNNVRRHLNATLTIQRKWKALLLMKENRKLFLHKNAAAISIQCFWRCVLARKQLSQLQQRMEKCLVLQRWWRSTLLMTKQRKEFNKIRESVVIVQCAWRNFVIKRDHSNLLNATLVLQRRWRAYKMMKTMKEKFCEMKISVIVIQCAWRRVLAIRKAVNIQKQTGAAKVIQQRWKAKILMEKEIQKFKVKKLAAVTIQTMWRCFLSKRILAEMKRRQNSVKLIQMKWRATLEMRNIRNNFTQKKNAAIVIQTAYRSYLAKIRVSRMRKELLAVKVIQARWRSTLQMQKDRQEYLKKKNAIFIIQNYFKCVLAKGELSEMRKRRNAVLVIQRIWKSILLRNREKDIFLKKRKAVIMLQCAFRSFVAKRTVDNLRERSNAAVILQSKWRYIALMKKEMRNYQLKKNAICRIQRVYRGYLVRKTITNQKVNRARRKCVLALRHAQKNPGLKISNRMDSVLSLLLDLKTYDQVYATLEDVYSLSHLLPYCCERISNAGGIEVLCELIINSNRSIHAAFVHKFSINILLNLIQNPSTRENTCRIMATTDQKHGTAPVELLVNLLPRFRDKSGRDPVQLLVFCATCSLLIEFCRDERNIEILKSKPKSVDMIRYVNKETMVKMKTKAYRNEEFKRKRQRDSVGYLSLSSTISEPNAANQSNFLDVTTRETSFICNMEMKRSSTPKGKQNKKNIENCDPATKPKQHARNPSTKKIVSNLFGGEGIAAAPPKVKQTLLTQRTSWNTNIPIHRSRKVTKPQSPKFQGARLKKLTTAGHKVKAIHPKIKEDEIYGPPTAPLEEKTDSSALPTVLRTIAYDDADPLNCINTLTELLR